MEKNILRELLLEQDQKKPLKSLVQRELWSTLSSHLRTPFIVIVSGVRRSGKSTLLLELREKVDNYYVNFDDERFLSFSVHDFALMYELLLELFGERSVFIFDEIQNVSGWERFVRRLHDEKKKVFITGSNATMLSREFGTHLTGRYVSFPLYPFSFKEFLWWKKEKNVDVQRLTSKQKSLLKRDLNEYLSAGGFPEFLLTGKEEYLVTLYENIIYRDIITRYKLPDERPLKETGYFAASNLGKELSFNKIRHLTGLSSATTIREYFAYLENSYLFFVLSRYDPSLAKQIYAPKKVYAIDPALSRLVGFRPAHDRGRLLENVVFLQLKRQNKAIYFAKEIYECDFIVRQGAAIVEAFQVTETLTNNKDREIQGLLETMTRFRLKEGTVITQDQEDVVREKGKKITILPLWKWLLLEK
ncbi:ATP-binding protein [Candidatus Woesearchaeota archaeon]|nr:ATP-binding protein [Candidatus Woesearchaeota archaeon]